MSVAIPNNFMFKDCRNCGKNKYILTSFPKKIKGGYSSTCKKCVNRLELRNIMKQILNETKCKVCNYDNCLNNSIIKLNNFKYKIKCVHIPKKQRTSTFINFNE